MGFARVLVILGLVACVHAFPNVFNFEIRDEEEWAYFLENEGRNVDEEILSLFKTPEEMAETEPVKLRSFSMKDCGTASTLVKVKSLTETPDPITIPGNINISGQVVVSKTVDSPLKGNVTIEKMVAGKYVKLPCFYPVGSCMYDDLCELLEEADCPDPIVSAGFDCRCPIKQMATLIHCLALSTERYRACGWSEGTKQMYRTQLSCYLDFCDTLGVEPVPASVLNISMYIAYLADVKNFKFSTIKGYLVIIKHLHAANDLPDPISGSWSLQHLLLGVKRELGDAQSSADPVTPEVLLVIHESLDLKRLQDLSIWVACLIGFFGLLRPGNFLCKGSFCADRDLQIQNLSLHDGGFVLNLYWTKTLQFRERVLQILLPDLKGHRLCPFSAVSTLLEMHFNRGAADDSPLLCNQSGKGLEKCFLSTVQSIVHRGSIPVHITGHSFRRGGATWAFKCGLPGELIQEMGFWKSDAYLRYLESDLQQKFNAVYRFGANLPS